MGRTTSPWGSGAPADQPGVAEQLARISARARGLAATGRSMQAWGAKAGPAPALAGVLETCCHALATAVAAAEALVEELAGHEPGSTPSLSGSA